MQRIVLGVDGSDGSIQATRVAGRLTADLGAELTAVHVRHVAPMALSAAPVAVAGDPDPQETLGAIEELARKRTAQALDPLDIPWAFRVRAGDPAAELEQAAAEQRADLIVVGSQGHTVVHRLLLGSVSTRLTHHAQRPVMVVPLT
jgi:nucleotide-binding universal stress UspA family protein